MDTEAQREHLMSKSFKMMFLILVIFGVPALLAYFVGNWADKTFDMRPIGSVLALLASAVVSWTILIRIYIKLDREFKELRKREEAEEKQNHLTTPEKGKGEVARTN